jgi:hypothetical protein
VDTTLAILVRCSTKKAKNEFSTGCAFALDKRKFVLRCIEKRLAVRLLA